MRDIYKGSFLYMRYSTMFGKKAHRTGLNLFPFFIGGIHHLVIIFVGFFLINSVMIYLSALYKKGL